MKSLTLKCNVPSSESSTVVLGMFENNLHTENLDPKKGNRKWRISLDDINNFCFLQGVIRMIKALDGNVAYYACINRTWL